MDLDELLTPFLTWQFVLSAVLINAILVYVTRLVRAAKPELLDRRWFKAILTVTNPVLGFAIAFVPSFLYGARFVERAFVGVCAGFLSNFVYALFIKRLAPSKEAAAPTSQVPKSEAITEELPESEVKKG
jgi:energy-converting hydrogenase Eha subunit A